MATEAVVSLLIQRLNYWLEEEDQSMAARHEAGNIRDELQRMSEFIRSADAIVVLVAESERDQQQAIRDWLQQKNALPSRSSHPDERYSPEGPPAFKQASPRKLILSRFHPRQ
ncbi:hypothetical protein ACLOJK_028029 [Asimina triloba]